MPYKIIKYAGKHKLKDTKSGKSVEIDIEKFMNGGGKKDKDLTEKEAQEIRDTTGVEFTDSGANALFERREPVAMPQTPDFNLGAYEGKGYFDVNYQNEEFNVSPTSANPGNYAKHKEYLDYLAKQNPEAKINRRPNQNGYVPMERRLGAGGSLDSLHEYMNGGKGKDKELAAEEARKLEEESGLMEGMGNMLFEKRSPVEKPVAPEFNLGRYKDVGYFNTSYQNGEFTVSPTSRNPGNHDKYEKYLDYLEEQNPDAKINRRPNQNGYVDFGNRLEYGGKPKAVPKYEDGTVSPCPPGDLKCAEERRLASTAGEVDYDTIDGAIASVEGPTSDVTMAEPAGLATEDTVAAGAQRDPFKPSNDISNQVSSDLYSSPDDRTRAEQTNPMDYTIANPYGGVDIPTAANYLGESIENGDALGIVAGGVKVAAGLGRNIVSGMGRQNRETQVMQKYYADQKKNRNVPQYVENGGKLQVLAYGGKKDEELATGEFMRGVSNEDTDEYNAEIEKGEYFQTNEGDIAEVVGEKHSSGGEKVQMESEDRVLSDKLKLGGKSARELSKKYGIKLRAKHTYSDVLDKYRKKTKLDKIIDEEAEVLKKIDEQSKVEDATTRDFNLDVLSKKREEITEKKAPIEEQRKMVFDELFNMQENSKPKSERANNEEFAEGGKKTPKYAKGVKVGDTDPVTGEIVTEEMAKAKLESGEWEALGRDRYVDRGEAGYSGAKLDSYRQTWDKEKFPNFEDYVSAAEQWKAENPNWNGSAGTPDQFYYSKPSGAVGSPAGVVGVNNNIDAPLPGRQYTAPSTPYTPEEEKEERAKSNGQGLFLFPPETPLPPSSLQGTIKPERRFDRVSPTEINVEPYLQDMRDREQAQVQSLEGLSPNVRAAVLANMRANTAKQESNTRNQIGTQNLSSQEKAEYANAAIQAREENASESDRLAYEQRQYRAQALTDNDINSYYTQLQEINKQRFMDISQLNLMNQANEDVFFDGQSYRRKTSNRDLIRNIKV